MSLREYTRSGRDNFEPVETELCFPCNACVYGVTPMPQQCNACCHNANAAQDAPPAPHAMWRALWSETEDERD